MKTIMRSACLAILLLFFANFLSAAEVYRWVDENGTPHFTDSPSKIPPAFRKRATIEEIGPATIIEPIAPFEYSDPVQQTDLNGHDQQWWRNQVRQWTEKKEEAALKLSEAEGELGKIEHGNEMITSRMAERNHLLKEIEKQQQALREAEEMIRTVLPEEARKAGAPPGWLR